MCACSSFLLKYNLNAQLKLFNSETRRIEAPLNAISLLYKEETNVIYLKFHAQLLNILALSAHTGSATPLCFHFVLNWFKT